MDSLDKVQATLESGEERLSFDNLSLNFSLLDFWKWSSSDLLSNATRGKFAEFVVATATNTDITQIRDEWSAFDLETPEGIKIEVKSAAYLQSWFQQKLSPISFTTKAAFVWDLITNKREELKRRSADVYVFCLLHPTEKRTVDPLNLNHWTFYVLATTELNNYKRSQHSITLNSLKKLTEATMYNQLKQEISNKSILNKKI